MARMQIVPLPLLRAGEYERTPFVIVLDQLGDDHHFTSDNVEQLRQSIGADAVVASEGVLDAADVQLTDAQRTALIDRLGLSQTPSGAPQGGGG